MEGSGLNFYKKSRSWYEVARRDLDTAKLLYEEDKYPEAVYYFQQSVEKATKSFGLLGEIIEGEDELIDIGHHPIDLYKKDLENKKEKVKKLENGLEEEPELKYSELMERFDLDSYSKDIKEGLESVESVGEWEDRFKNISEDDIDAFLDHVNRLEKDFEDKKGAKITKEDKERLEKQKEEILEFIEILIQSEKTSEHRRDQLKEVKSELKNKKYSDILDDPVFSRSIKLVLDTIFINKCLIILGSIMNRFQSIYTRYPKDGKKPSERYDEQYLLIKEFEKFQDLIEKALNKLEVILRRRKEQIEIIDRDNRGI